MGVLFALACSIWALIKLLSLMSLCLCLVLCDARRNCVCIARYSTKLRIRLELVYVFLQMIVWHSARRTRTSATTARSTLTLNPDSMVESIVINYIAPYKQFDNVASNLMMREM
jgi:hypothetical protein